METPRTVLWRYVDEVSHLAREQEPMLFTPWGARSPYAWSGLSHSLRLRSKWFHPALEAAVQLTSDKHLRTIYSDTDPDGLPVWVTNQVENLARRSMLVVSRNDELGDAFKQWYPLFLRALNSKVARAIHISEVPYLDRLHSNPLVIATRAETWPVPSRTSVSIQHGSIEGLIEKTGIHYPIEMQRSYLRMSYDAVSSVLVSVTTAKKERGYISSFNRDAGEDMYLRTLRMVTGQNVRSGAWYSGEISTFPEFDPHFFDVDQPRRYWDKTRVTLTDDLHARIKRLQRRVPELSTYNPNVQPGLQYAHRKLESAILGTSGWSDLVVDVVSAMEALFSDSSRPGGRQLAQRIAWLGSTKPSERDLLFHRFSGLYTVRNQVLHNGQATEDMFRRAATALGMTNKRPPEYPPGMIDGESFKVWETDAQPRLVALLQWGVLFAAHHRTSDDQARVGWPFRGQRDLDGDMLLSRHLTEWHQPNRKLPSPLRNG